jgi:O-glycosyl hydrolase
VRRLSRLVMFAVALCVPVVAAAQTLTFNPAARKQTIDGFGTCTWDTVPDQSWYAPLYYNDLGASILRVDLTPRFKSPYSDWTYNSPWFHNNPALPGPEGNNVRTYTGAADYSRLFAGRQAQIAVMGPSLDNNISRTISVTDPGVAAGARLAQRGRDTVSNFKLHGSIWSPAPWLKVSSGNTQWQGLSWPFPPDGVPYPFIWYDDFAGGVLDTSGIGRSQFNDSAFGGTGNTSALTQYARSTAAYVAAYQRTYGVNFHSLSIQNEPNLETFYSSCLYKTSADFIAALKAVRTEFDRWPELRNIKLVGPEDIMGEESTYLWFWDNNGRRDKFLKFMRDIEADPVAKAALWGYAIHGYAGDGVSSAGAVPNSWNWVKDGWSTPPNPAVPANVNGYADFGKNCWMTESSGEQNTWLAYRSGSTFPSEGAWSIALKLHQALTVGDVTAWMYWQLSTDAAVDGGSATDATLRDNSPKYVALKHYFKYIRPGYIRIDAPATGDPDLLASAYMDPTQRTFVLVLLNQGSDPFTTQIVPPASLVGTAYSFEVYVSSNGALWQQFIFPRGTSSLTLPGYSVGTIVWRTFAVIPEPLTLPALLAPLALLHRTRTFKPSERS